MKDNISSVNWLKQGIDDSTKSTKYDLKDKIAFLPPEIPLLTMSHSLELRRNVRRRPIHLREFQLFYMACKRGVKPNNFLNIKKSDYFRIVRIETVANKLYLQNGGPQFKHILGVIHSHRM